ncbi:MAG: hypothetical protein IE928_10580 [Gammaproteobacteria bacterium]|nr:hypothetical protein [Gammaproteobacteria bacterium]
MTMIVYLPQNFQISAISKFTSQIVGSNGRPLADIVTLDFSKLSFIDGGGYTVLSNSIEWLINENVEVRLRNFDNVKNLAIQYLDDCGFFKTYANRFLRHDAKVRDTTLPCSFVTHERSFGWVQNQLSPWLERIFDVDHAALGSVRTCVKEVLNNTADHSNVSTGFVHAQFYPNLHLVKITLSDFGDGIPRTITRTFGSMPDAQAIIHATKEGVTSKSRPNNMGAGLSYLVDTMIANRGITRFHSRYGNVTCLRDNQGRKRFHQRHGTGMYPGTLVELEFDTRLFIGDEVERGDLEW